LAFAKAADQLTVAVKRTRSEVTLTVSLFSFPSPKANGLNEPATQPFDVSHQNNPERPSCHNLSNAEPRLLAPRSLPNIQNPAEPALRHLHGHSFSIRQSNYAAPSIGARVQYRAVRLVFKRLGTLGFQLAPRVKPAACYTTSAEINGCSLAQRPAQLPPPGTGSDPSHDHADVRGWRPWKVVTGRA
jgi:hypothetical protein